MLTEALVLIIPVILIFIGYLLKKYYFYGHSCKLKKKLHGKIAIVTGANSGIGFETAMDFAHRGATVILACRDIEKAYKASSKIVVSSRNENVFADRLDLADLDSIRSFAERFMNRFNRLDLLVNNAGAFNKNYRKTVDGFEMSFGVMHLGHFYLTNLLLEHLKKSSPSRIINVSSDMHRGIEIRWKNIQLENDYNPIFAYRQAKLANILFTLELSKRLKDTNVGALSLHPGFVSTEIYRDFEQEDNTLKSNLFNSLFKLILRLCAQDCKQGAQTTIFCALVDDLEINGKYFSNCQVSICSKQGEDEEAAKQLWDLSARLVKLN